MIRLIINEVTGVCKRPSKKHLTDIARRIVAKYPKSLQDVIEGHIVGSGYDSLVKQLQSRADNVKRTQFSTPKDSFNTVVGATAKERALPQDTYGCINWDPEHLPITETLASQKQQQEEMKTMFRERNWDTQIITKKMMATYYTQRKDIIRGMETEKIRREWPFLFEMPGLQAHFRALTGVQLEGKFFETVKNKSHKILAYMDTLNNDKQRKTARVLAQIEVAKKDTKSKLPEMPGLVLLLLAYFGEDDKQMFFQVDDTCLPSEVPTSDLPASPCIIFCGMCFGNPCICLTYAELVFILFTFG